MVKNSVMLERRWYQEFISTMIDNILQPQTFQQVNNVRYLPLIYVGSAVYMEIFIMRISGVARNFYGTLDQALLVRIAFYGAGDSVLTSHK
jgi:hypothetical protein